MTFSRSLKRGVDGEGWPYAFVFPAEQSDPSSTARLFKIMQQGGIEIHRAKKPFTAEGRDFAAGSHVIVLRQPYAAWAKTMLEIQEYPDLRRSPEDDPVVPYDVTAQTLPMMMGVEAAQVEESFDADLSLVKNEIVFEGIVTGQGLGGFIILPNSNEAYAVADALLDDGHRVGQLKEAFTVADRKFPAGSFYVFPNSTNAASLHNLAKKWNFTAVGLDRSEMTPEGVIHRLRDPRVGIYEPWGGLMDAGWTRFMLEQWELEPKTVRNADIKAGNLASQYDIILFADGLNLKRVLEDTTSWPDQYKGGITEKGRDHLREFVLAGGTVAAFGRSSMTLAQLLDLPITNGLEGLRQKQYFAPGSLVLTELDPLSPLSYGLPDKLPVMNRKGPAFMPKATTKTSPQMHGRYPSYDSRLSGFLLGEEHLQGKGSIAVQPMGDGRAILFSMTPQFRAMTHGSYKLVFNAIFWSARRDSQEHRARRSGQ